MNLSEEKHYGVPWQNAFAEVTKVLHSLAKSTVNDPGSVLYEIFSGKDTPGEMRMRLNIPSSTRAIDPITLFCAFNRSENIERRSAILKFVMGKLGTGTQFEKIDMRTCPRISSKTIAITRTKEVNGQIWTLFDRVMKKNRNGFTAKDYDQVKSWEGIDIATLTTFLFWIQPNSFLPQDKYVVELLKKNRIINKDPKNFDDYMGILPVVSSPFYAQIARFAPNRALQSSRLGKPFLKELRTFYGKKQVTETTISNFRIIAIRPLPRLLPKYRKVLIKGQLYQWYDQYVINDSTGAITYNPNIELKLYNLESVEVQISATVGKNGSGKSALMDLLLMAINNIAFFKKQNTENAGERAKGIFLEIYYHADSIYRIDLKGDQIEIYRYDLDGDTFYQGSPLNIQDFDLEDFFYSVFVNYSFYALNSNDLGEWLDQVFDKNDAYQKPVVLNPHRSKGTMNPNIENRLAVSRLLSTILEITEKNQIQHRILTDDQKMATHLVAGFHNFEQQNEPELSQFELELFKQIKAHYKFDVTGFRDEIQLVGPKYITRKAIKMVKYPAYKEYRDESTELPRLDIIKNYLQHIDQFPSHITVKFKQAINYFKYKTYKHFGLDTPLPIDDYIQAMLKIKNKYGLTGKVKEEELLPPPFIRHDIILDNDIDFNSLSSGEKQKIYSLSTIIYHLKNLESVSDRESYISYSKVNIVFDEIELYFHPDMQRTFIDSLLTYLARASFQKISFINICFVTHSPFILSDIQHTNTLFIEKGVPRQMSIDNPTFGGNIHDMLANNFFLEKSLMGEYAKKTIDSAVDFLKSKIENKDYDNFRYKWDQESTRNFIDHLGEPLIQRSLRQLYSEVYLKEESAISAEIKRLTDLQKSLTK